MTDPGPTTPPPPRRQSSATTSARSIRRPLSFAVVILSVVTQLVMVVIGTVFVLSDDTDTTIGTLVVWCLIGSVYAIVALVVFGRLSKKERSEATKPSKLEVSRPTRFVSFTATLFSSLVGLLAAFQVLSLRDDPDYGPVVDLVGVWAMLVAWAFLHWGFAQMYLQQYFASSTPTMRFPGTPHPGIIEFVYFSYTLGTSFAASDVEVHSTRIRWRVIWHSVLSFFFNGLIIVLALNTILSIGTPA